MYTVSVLISTYNGEKYIHDQLDSLYSQTQKIDEVLIIDDCSTDNTVYICQKFIKDHLLNNSWRIEINPYNKGWKKNFHEGQKKTSGEILMFCDQDDIWLPEKVSQAVSYLQQHPKINVFATNEKLLFNDGSVKEPENLGKEIEIIDIGRNKKDFFIRCSGCTMAIRRSFINLAFDYFVESWAHDDMMWKIAGATGSFALSHQPMIQHRIHGNNESRKKRRSLNCRLEGAQMNVKNYSAFLDYLKANNVTPAMDVTATHIAGNKTRIKFFKEKKIIDFLRLLFKYSSIYQTKHQFCGDLAVLLKRS